VFCVHRRDLEGQDAKQWRFTVMSIPISSTTSNASSNSGNPGASVPATIASRLYVDLGGGDGGGGGARGVIGSVQQRWDHISGSATGGFTKACQKAFVEFCRCAQRMGYLEADGAVVSAFVQEHGGAARENSRFTASLPVSSAAASAAGAGAVVAGWEPDLAALRVRCSYTKTGTPSVVFVGQRLCLCSRMTWQWPVLQYFSEDQARVMTSYNDDMWSSRIEPQILLRE
jgi:hypothetical protein